MSAIEALPLGGPADGCNQLVETDVHGQLPSTMHLLQAGIFVGADDQPTATINLSYDYVANIDGHPVPGGDHNQTGVGYPPLISRTICAAIGGGPAGHCPRSLTTARPNRRAGNDQ